MGANERPRLIARQERPAAPLTAPRPPPVPGSTILVLSGPIARADVPALCERARVLLQRCGDPVVCDVGGVVEPDAVTIDALAHLQLVARRLGRTVWFRRACGDLERLLVLSGLGEVLPCGPSSGIEARGQPEEREQALRVEEEADPGDPAV